MDHDVLVALKALADPNRLRVAGACAADSRTVSQLASELAMPEPAVRRHLERLIAAGLIEAVDATAAGAPAAATAVDADAPAAGAPAATAVDADAGAPAAPAAEAASAARSGARYALRVDVVHALGRRLAAIEDDAGSVSDVSGPDGAPLPAAEARVIHGFFRDDRLTTIPSQAKKRLVVIRYLRDRCFAEDRPYPEKEVNQRLALFHPDVATLRRAMVDEGLMTREAGVYRRPG